MRSGKGRGGFGTALQQSAVPFFFLISPSRPSFSLSRKPTSPPALPRTPATHGMDTTSLSFQTLAKPLQKRGGGEDCAERTRGE